MKCDYKEIFKLKVLLDINNIEYEFYDRSILGLNKRVDRLHYQIIIYKDKEKTERLISIVEGLYTYGYEVDKLEIMGLLTEDEEKHDSVVGYLTANEVLDRIIRNVRS